MEFSISGVDGASWRPMPFWSWNDKLEPEELCRRIAEAARLRCREAYTDDITAAALLLERA